MPLIVTGVNPVVLDGSIDSSNNLQMKHGSDSLADYDQTLHAKHAVLNPPPTGTVLFKLVDFSHGGANWTISVSHSSGESTVYWSRDDVYAYADFGTMTDALEVDVAATSNASPPQTKTRKIWIKSMPINGQGD